MSYSGVPQPVYWVVVGGVGVIAIVWHIAVAGLCRLPAEFAGPAGQWSQLRLRRQRCEGPLRTASDTDASGRRAASGDIVPNPIVSHRRSPLLNGAWMPDSAWLSSHQASRRSCR